MEVFSVPTVGAVSNDYVWDNPNALARVRDVQFANGSRFYPQNPFWNNGDRVTAGKTQPNMYRKINLNLEEQRRPYANDAVYYRLPPVAGAGQVPCAILFNVGFGSAAGTRDRDRKKVYRRAAILDFRNVGGNATWVKYWSGYPYGGPEGPLPIGISFWHNGGFDPQFFRIDYQWSTIPARSQTLGSTQQLPPLGNMYATSGGVRMSAFHSTSDYAGMVNDRAAGKFQGRNFQMAAPTAGTMSASRTGYRITNSENKNHFWWWQHLSRPGGQVYRVDFEACKDFNLCLVTVRVFGHQPIWSDET